MPNKKKNLDAPVTLRDFKEFVNFAVKTFTTKDDLKAFATKDDLKGLKNELDNKIYKLDNKIYKLDNKIDSIKDEILASKDEILTSNDKLARKLDTDATERIMTISALDRHEARITQLEKHTGLVK